MIRCASTVGFQFYRKTFDYQSNSGQLADKLLELYKYDRNFKPNYFSHFQALDTFPNQSLVFFNFDKSITLKIDNVQILFQFKVNKLGESVEIEKMIDDAKRILKFLKRQMNIPDFRRIGIVSDFVLEKSISSSVLFNALTMIKSDNPVRKATLRFEESKNDKPNEPINLDTSSFSNTIYTIENKEKIELDPSMITDGFMLKDNFVTVVIDTQQYYNPAIDSYDSELKKLLTQHKVNKNFIRNKLVELELFND